jgi:hypothetical protein
MASNVHSFGRITSPHWQSLWRGTGQSRVGLVRLVWGFLRLILTGWLWGTAVRLANFQPPINTIGAVLAVLSIIVFIWALWGMWQGFRSLGIKRLAITLTIIYSLVVAFNVLTQPDDRSITERILAQLSATGRQVLNTMRGAVASLAQAPDEFLFAYTGQRTPPSPPPGFPTPDPESTPIQAVARPASGRSAPSSSLKIGGYALVMHTDGESLRARTEPGMTLEIIARFQEGTRLLIVEGPISGDGLRWWKVRSEQGEEGWCADQWLTPTE